MSTSTAELADKNKQLVLDAFDCLFNKRDYAKAETFWSPDYVQHSAHIGPGRQGVFDLVKGLPATLRYEPGLVLANDTFVMLHGRYSGFGPVSWIVTDIVKVEMGALVEHWDVIEDEATEKQSKSGSPMFGLTFPAEQ